MKEFLLLIVAAAVILVPSSQALVVGSDVGGMAYVGFELGVGELDVGLTYSSLVDDATKTTGAMLRYVQPLAKVSKATLGWGVEIDYTSVDGGASMMALQGLLCGEYMVDDVLAIYGNVAILNYRTTTPAVGDATKSYWVITGPVMAYTGIKLYI